MPAVRSAQYTRIGFADPERVSDTQGLDYLIYSSQLPTVLGNGMTSRMLPHAS